MSKMTKTIAALGVVAGLGVAALPLSSYAVNSDPLTVKAQAVVGESISVTADAADDTVTITDVIANKDVKEESTVLTIETNNTSGYNVSIKDADSVTALTTDGTNAANGIPASADLTAGNKGWGFKASTTTEGVSAAASANYRAILDTPVALASRSTGASVTDGDKVTLTFGVVVDSSIAAGTYYDDVVITASTNS